MQVVLASHNAHKLEELRRVLQPLVPGLELISYSGPEPQETGVTFEQNAVLKARAAAEHTGLPALADDSGISVAVMGGAPGIFSARWSGRHGADADNVQLLLAQLADIPDGERGCEFVCAAALALPAGDVVCELGHWPGTVLRAPAGEGGFGYDPIFRPEGESCSAAELTPQQKDALSHRRRAFTALAPAIASLLA